MRWAQPSQIQAEALPVVLRPDRPNLIAQAHHGSGKTATYAITMLMAVDWASSALQAVCVAPTRELADQIAQVTAQLGEYHNVSVCRALPSVKSSNLAHVMVGTPGTVLAKAKSCQMSEVKMLVLDEADEMVAEGSFSDFAAQIKGALPARVQVLLFSATFAECVCDSANQVAPNAVWLRVRPQDLALKNIAQFTLHCDGALKKPELLSSLFAVLSTGKAIIFVQTVKTCDSLTRFLLDKGHTVSCFYGKNMRPEERDLRMSDFRGGQTKIMVTTNVLGRGLDIAGVDCVVNYDLPLTKHGRPDAETYLHRIGRTGRFGRRGIVFNFVHDARSEQVLAAISHEYQTTSQPLPFHLDDDEYVKAVYKAVLQGTPIPPPPA